MRKNIACILFLFIFISLQYGKVVSYLYCKWQTEILPGQTDCGCDDHLVALFDHSESGDTNSILKNTMQEKLTEFSQPFPSIDLSASFEFKKIYFTEFTPIIRDSFIPAAFHPPAA